MTNRPWHQDPLAYLVGDVSASAFFADYYEQQALIAAHDDGGRYGALLSLARIDDILANSELPPGALNMARKEPPIKRSYFTFANGNIDRGAVIHHYQQGATIILPQLHLADAALADFCRTLEWVFSARVQTNVYLTPANSQGFSTHYDDHDVFVMQIAGEKRWRLYEKPVEKPYRGEKFQSAIHKPGHPEQDFLLRAGDCVYIPRGLMHDAMASGDSPSLHITVGLLGQSWADLMLEALSEVALRDAGFRRSLPSGYAHPDFDRGDARRCFTSLLDRFREQADFDEVFELMREKYLRSLRPDIKHSLTAASTIDIEKRGQVSYKKRKHVQALLRHDDNEVVVVCAGGDIYFDTGALDGLQQVLSGEPVTAATFASLDLDTAQAVIAKLLAFGVVEATEGRREP